MEKSEKRSIRVNLFYLITIFGIIISIIFIGIGVWLVVNDTSVQVKQTLVLETQRTNSKVEDYYTKLRQVIEHLSTIPHFMNYPFQPETLLLINGELEKARCSYSYLFVYFGIESDGSVLNYPAPEGYDSRKRPWYIKAVEKGGLSITEPYPDAATGVLVTTIAKPVVGSNGRIGVIAIDSSLQEIVDIVFSRSDLFKSAMTLLLSPDGRVIIAREQNLLNKEFPLDSLTGEAVQSVIFNGKRHLVSILENNETGFWIVSLVSPNEIMVPAVKLILVLLCVITGLLLLFIIAMNKIVHKMIVSPITEIASDMKQIQSLNLDGVLSHTSKTYEIWLMQNSLDNMKKGLRSFRKYVPADVVNILLKEDIEASLGAEKRDLTIMFSDIADFTALSERFAPDKLAVHLGYYFTGMTSILQSNNATVDKFIGDAIMSFWGAPLPVKDHAKLACKSALECLDFLAETRNENIHPDFRTRIGITTGEAIVGNMGYEQRMSYTAIGDSVNTASRFEGLNKYFGTSILVCEQTWQLAKDDFAFREIDTVVVKGKSVGLRVFELIDYNYRVTPAMKSWLEKYESAMSAYRAREWRDSLKIFKEIYDSENKDKAMRIIIKRLQNFVRNPPPADWSGEVWLRGK